MMAASTLDRRTLLTAAAASVTLIAPGNAIAQSPAAAPKTTEDVAADSEYRE